MIDQKRKERLTELSSYIDNSIMMCDNEAELLGLASLMMVYSRNIIIDQLGENVWRKVVENFVKGEK
jgi:hypothetical protein